MSHDTNVGILGLGAYLPPEVRGNDWWPQSVVSKWVAKRAEGRAKHAGAIPENLTPGMARVMKAVQEIENDPFQGAVSRHVLPEGMLSSDMEQRAAEQAIASAGIDPAEIDLVL